jgi:hypothetical protein
MITFLLVFLVICILLIVSRKSQVLFFRFNRIGKVEFLSAEETAEYLLDDPDRYHANLSKYDLYAQGAKSIPEIKRRAADSAVSFTEGQKDVVRVLVKKIDQWFVKHLRIPFVDHLKIANLPWVLSLTANNIYEKGYPHTRDDIIFLPEELVPSDLNDKYKVKEFAVTLAHEKIHVYSRLYPVEMKKWMNAEGYKKIGVLKDYKLGRSNPDIDSIVYQTPDGLPAVAIYNSEKPKGIFDAFYPGRENDDPANEHPNETLAYKIDKMFGEYFSHI